MEQEVFLATCSSEQRETVPLHRERVSWQPPVEGRIKFNWDAATKPISGKEGFRVVARDCEDDIVCFLGANLQSSMEPVVAECTALLHAMKLCSELGYQQVDFEGDA